MDIITEHEHKALLAQVEYLQNRLDAAVGLLRHYDFGHWSNGCIYCGGWFDHKTNCRYNNFIKEYDND